MRRIVAHRTTSVRIGGERKAVTALLAAMLVISAANAGGSFLSNWPSFARAATDDANWSVVPSPDDGTRDSLLWGVSCTSAAACIAVGYSYDHTGSDPAGYQTLVESWDGATWSVIPSPSPGTGQQVNYNYLKGVSCLSPTACTAVGSFYDGSASLSLIESWDGTSWSVVPSPNVPGRNSDLWSVSCTSPTACVAVGHSFGGGSATQTLVESWDGTSWSIVPSPNAGSAENWLLGVSCTSATHCVAVGQFYNGVSYEALVESWDGTSWSIVAIPSIGSSALIDVSCISETSCTAVGGASRETLVESWDGTSWSIVPSPNADASFASNLWGVSCASAAACTAVGRSARNVDGSGRQTLIESWDGTSWSIVESPDAGTGESVLMRVSCASDGGCAAVGWREDAGQSHTLVVMRASSSVGPSVSCTPGSLASSTTVDVGTTVACTFTRGSSETFSGWTTKGWSDGSGLQPNIGFTPTSSSDPSQTFIIDRRGAEIDATYVDQSGATRSIAFRYAIAGAPFTVWAPWPTDVALKITGSSYGEGRHSGQDLYAVDYSIPGGGCGTRVLAAFNGKVTLPKFDKKGYGQSIIVTDPTGRYQARYAHLDETYVKDGAQILHGDEIGTIGNTGYSFGCHLHFAVYLLDANGVRWSVPLPEVLVPADRSASISSTNSLPTFSAGSWSVPEGAPGTTTTFYFFISMHEPQDLPATVMFKTVDGTAKAKSGDYTAIAGTLTFDPGTTTGLITVQVDGDKHREADETFLVLLDSPVTIGKWTTIRASGIGTILNDDN